jgi:hypothetical protein
VCLETVRQSEVPAEPLSSSLSATDTWTRYMLKIAKEAHTLGMIMDLHASRIHDGFRDGDDLRDSISIIKAHIGNFLRSHDVLARNYKHRLVVLFKADNANFNKLCDWVESVAKKLAIKIFDVCGVLRGKVDGDDPFSYEMPSLQKLLKTGTDLVETMMSRYEAIRNSASANRLSSYVYDVFLDPTAATINAIKLLRIGSLWFAMQLTDKIAKDTQLFRYVVPQDLLWVHRDCSCCIRKHFHGADVCCSLCPGR